MLENFLMISSTISAPIETVWRLWTEPQHMMQWYRSSNGWYTTHVENELMEQGHFKSRMQREGSPTYVEYLGTYQEVSPLEHLRYQLEDGRLVEVMFIPLRHRTKVIEIFEDDQVNDPDAQRASWQSILDRFTTYVEAGNYTLVDQLNP